MASWRVARSLAKLRDQVNAAAPGRSRRSDGTIGDASHQNRSSDHNPWVGPGVVTALDLTHDPGTFDAHALGERIRVECKAGRETRVKYLISNGRIASSRQAWSWRKYTGPNPHRTHLHISVVTSRSAYDDTRPWRSVTGTATPKPPAPTPEETPMKPTDSLRIAGLASKHLNNLKRLSAQTAWGYAAAGGFVVISYLAADIKRIKAVVNRRGSHVNGVKIDDAGQAAVQAARYAFDASQIAKRIEADVQVLMSTNQRRLAAISSGPHLKAADDALPSVVEPLQIEPANAPTELLAQLAADETEVQA